MQRNTLDIFEIVKPILARNLEVDPEAIDLEFKFHSFIDRLAAQRQQQALDNAYRAAASGGESTSFRFDSNAIFSKPSSRLKTLKSIIDDARRSPKN